MMTAIVSGVVYESCGETGLAASSVVSFRHDADDDDTTEILNEPHKKKINTILELCAGAVHVFDRDDSSSFRLISLRHCLAELCVVCWAGLHQVNHLLLKRLNPWNMGPKGVSFGRGLTGFWPFDDTLRNR